MTTLNVNIPAYAATFGLEGPAPRLSDWLARVILQLQSGDWLRMPAPGVPEATAQLLEHPDRDGEELAVDLVLFKGVLVPLGYDIDVVDGLFEQSADIHEKLSSGTGRFLAPFLEILFAGLPAGDVDP